MAEETADESLLHMLRQFAGSARQSAIFKSRLPAAPTLPADALDFRFAADTLAKADAEPVNISSAPEELLGTKESDDIEYRSLTPSSVDLPEEDIFSRLSEAKPPAIEIPTDQDENSYSSEEESCVFYEVTAEKTEPRSTKTAAEISKLVLERLCRIESFPKVGIDVTVYGFGAGWNAMLTFSPGSTTVSNAMIYRKILPKLVAEMRKHLELI
jgi:hypothetical protein